MLVILGIVFALFGSPDVALLDGMAVAPVAAAPVDDGGSGGPGLIAPVAPPAPDGGSGGPGHP